MCPRQSDADRSGQISSLEFSVMLRPLVLANNRCRGRGRGTGGTGGGIGIIGTDALLDLAFADVDVDGSGLITLGELRDKLKVGHLWGM